MTVLSIQQLAYARQYRWILEDINIDLSSGQLLCVTGNNGSGKTSLLRIVCGLSEADEGRILWNNVDTRTNRTDYFSNMCYVGHKDGIKDDLSVAENIFMMCALYKNTEYDSHYYIDAMELPNPNAMTVTLSAGQRRRLALARCLIAKKTLWLLDEPFTALDRHGIALVVKHIAQHLDNGGMVMMASHHAIDLPAEQVKELNLSQ